MDALRYRGRGRFLACFRPAFVADDDVPVSYSSSLHPSGDEAAGRSKRNLRRSFSAALKAVILKSVLLNKYRSQTHHEKGLGEKGLDGLRSKILSRGKSFVKTMKKNVSSRKQCLEADEAHWSHNSNRSPLFSSNSSSRASSVTSSTASSSQRSSPARSETDAIQRAVSLDRHIRRTNATKNKQKTMSGKRCGYGIPTLEMCVVMICLFALIWGKAFAVVSCTSAWLFLAPSRRSPKLRRGGSLEVMESEEYKKRVIMEGWLERDRSRVLQY